jgi:hypothetical protein
MNFFMYQTSSFSVPGRVVIATRGDSRVARSFWLVAMLALTFARTQDVNVTVA